MGRNKEITHNVAAHVDSSGGPQPGKAGLGIVIVSQNDPTKQLVVAIPTDGITNNGGEILAVAECIKLMRTTPGKTELVIGCDSAYVVNGLWRIQGWIEAGWRTAAGKWVANQNEWEELLEAIATAERNRIHVSVVKISSGQNLADLVAKNARITRIGYKDHNPKLELGKSFWKSLGLKDPHPYNYGTSESAKPSL